MMQILEPDVELTIRINGFSNPPEYIAWISGQEYMGIVVRGKDVRDCLNELRISLEALEQFRKNKK